MARKKGLTAEQAQMEDTMDRWTSTKELSTAIVEGHDEQPQDTNNIEDAPQADNTVPEVPSEDIGNQEGTPPSEESSHDWEKRYKDIQRYNQELKDQAAAKDTLHQEEISKLSSQVNDQKTTSIPKTAEEMKAFQEANPDLFDYMVSLVREGTTEVSTKLEAELEKQRIASATLEKVNKLSKLKEIHPDAETIESSAEFKTWLDTQSPLTKQMVSSKDATVADLAFVIRNYKEAKGIVATPKTKQKASQTDAALAATSSSSATPSESKKIWKVSEIAKLNARDFAKYEADIDKARLEGRVQDDIHRML
jgi:hypothetical protein